MNAVVLWRVAHELSIFLYMAGRGATLIPVYRSWWSQDLPFQMQSLRLAADNNNGILLPAALLTGATGVFWGAAAGHHFLRDTWLLVLWLTYALSVLVLMPLLNMGMRRVRLALLVTAKAGSMTPELEQALADKVPAVIGALLVICSVVMALLGILQPF